MRAVTAISADILAIDEEADEPQNELLVQGEQV